MTTMENAMNKVKKIPEVNNNSSIVAKAGLWYTICNFLFRGMAFITTPIFTRLLSKDELGTFSNFSSWISILTVVTSFDLAQSVIRSKLEHEDDMDSYMWSILAFSTIWTVVVYFIVCLFPAFFSKMFQVDMKYIHIMFLYLLVAPAYSMFITKQRAFYRYKTFVVLTGIMTISGTLLSLIMVVLMDDDKLAGRIFGYYIPYIAISAVIYVLIIAKGRKVKIGYWRYACVICLPLVPHTLSLYLLSSSDKIIITNLCGAEYTAIYSVAYSAYHIVTILFDSMNKAWAPWLLESLHMQRYNEIQKISKIYIGLFAIFIGGIMLIVPEIIFILGGKQYLNAVYCLPPLITSCMFQFVYTMYVNIEFYEKKTLGVCIATIIATGINIVLNLIFIPMSSEYSYIIAAYTTLCGYMVLFVLHYVIVKKMKKDFVYDIKFIVCLLGIIFILSLSMNYFYNYTIIRYITILFYGIVILYLGLKNKYNIARIFKNTTKGKK